LSTTVRTVGLRHSIWRSHARSVILWVTTRRAGITTKGITSMGFCEHCDGQRFDRAQVLRQLRQTRARLRDEVGPCTADEALLLAIKSVRALEVPHLEPIDDLMGETTDDQVIH